MTQLRSTYPRPPPHLAPNTKQWWTSVVQSYELEPHHTCLLQLAAESWDRGQQARETLAKEGLTVVGSTGNIKAHPAVAIERDSRLAFARILRELDLDSEPPVSVRIGPPALRSNSGVIHARKAAPRKITPVASLGRNGRSVD